MIKEFNLKRKGRFHYAKAWTVPTAVLSLSLGLANPAFAQREDAETPVDLTKLVRTTPDNASDPDDAANTDVSDTLTVQTLTSDDNQTGQTAAAGTSSDVNDEADTTTASPIVTSSTSISVSSSLTQKDPSSIRLGSLGLERDDVDGLGRLMWDGSDASTALALLTSLDPAQTPRALRPVLDHVMAARAVPPAGFIDIAPDIINAKLAWMASSGASEDLAAMIRQLPDSSAWEDPKAWLIMHDLITRNDSDACRTAQKKVLITLDALWHQVNAFCAVVRGEDMKAAFALDILQDSGVDDPLYFELMRSLTNGDTVSVDDQMDVSLLNLVLLDSARVSIQADALKTLPESYSGTANSLRYLSPSATRLIGARSYGLSGSDVAASWALLPRDGLSSAEALTRLRFGGDDDTLALARLNAWHSISQEKDDLAKASLAFEALIADYAHSGLSSLNLWLPMIEGGINSEEIDAKIGPMMGLAQDPSKVLLNDEAAAWQDLLTPSSRPVSQDALTAGAAFDAIPLIAAMGRPVSDIDWSRVETDAASLTSGASLPYAALKQIEDTAARGHQAETVLRIAQLLQGRSFASINREDAARLVAVLMDMGMTETGQNLAQDILMTWVMDRHMSSMGASAESAAGAS